MSNFDTSSVTSMADMFRYASSFNGDVSNFDTSRVTNIGGMFRGASSFNQDVSSFDLSSVTDMRQMFYGATSFDQDLCSWRDSFPYNAAVMHIYNAKQAAEDIFTNSGCTYQDTPDRAQSGPFCASDCQ